MTMITNKNRELTPLELIEQELKLAKRKRNEAKTNITVPLHYILKLGTDYYHQQVSTCSVEDMQEKAEALEVKFGVMELNIKVKKKNLVISAILTNKTVNRGKFAQYQVEDDGILDTGILFNPPLAKQLNKVRNEIETSITLDELLEDKPMFESEACALADDWLDDTSSVDNEIPKTANLGPHPLSKSFSKTISSADTLINSLSNSGDSILDLKGYQVPVMPPEDQPAKPSADVGYSIDE